MTGARPTVSLILDHPTTVADVAKWAELANVIGFPEESPVAAHFESIKVTAWLSDAYVPNVVES